MGYSDVSHAGRRIAAISLLSMMLVSFACSSQKKLEELRSQRLSATIALSNDIPEEDEFNVRRNKDRDSVIITDENGNEITYMSAKYDSETSEMTLTDVLDAAVITARFRNIAERHGKIDLCFDLLVPQRMQDSEWQLRFYPDMYILEDTLRLNSVYVTGAGYRHGQIRGYERYNRFLSTIISDSTAFIDLKNLDRFIERNIPNLYRFKTDSTFVSEEEFVSVYGVTERMAIEHYTNKFSKKMNERRKARRDKMYAKYVKAPILTEGIRLDTVIQNINGDFIYQYVQTINTRPKLRKVDIVLSGEIYKQDVLLYTMDPTEPLSFYISSISAFVDETERYLTKVVERRVTANTQARVDFAVGKADIDKKLSDNTVELERIEGYLRDILEDSKFDLDSLVVTASASPEGRLDSNNRLSARRAASVSEYCDRFVQHYKDSLANVYRQEARETFYIEIDDEGHEIYGKPKVKLVHLPNIKFVSNSGGENWSYLGYLVEKDSTMTPAQKEDYFNKCRDIRDVDIREASMKGQPYYQYMKSKLYPELRTVHFEFNLHRKGMIKDTVHTTMLDTVYMAGVQAIKDRDYHRALEYLKDYNDYNTAIVYVSLDYNASALAILENLEKTDRVNYMLALLYSRRGEEQKAVQHYMTSCRQNPSYVYRGNLDPEIAALIKKYNLNAEPEEDEWNLY